MGLPSLSVSLRLMISLLNGSRDRLSVLSAMVGFLNSLLLWNRLRDERILPSLL